VCSSCTIKCWESLSLIGWNSTGREEGGDHLWSLVMVMKPVNCLCMSCGIKLMDPMDLV
jgi:hypothetical protein